MENEKIRTYLEEMKKWERAVKEDEIQAFMIYSKIKKRLLEAQAWRESFEKALK